MSAVPSPPDVARRVLGVCLRGESAEFLLGDLEERFRDVAEARGPRAAARWYRRHAWRAIVAWWHPLSVRARRRHGSRARRRESGARRRVGRMARAAAALSVGIAAVALARARRETGVVEEPGATRVLVHAIDREGQRFQRFTFPEVAALRARATALTSLAGYSFAERMVEWEGAEPFRAVVGRISEGYFAAVGATAAYGRLFTAAELRDGADVAVLGYELWTGALARDSAILGSTITIRGVPLTVVGVMRSGVGSVARADLWRPATAWLRRDGDREVSIVARVARGATLEDASREVAALVAGMRTARYGPAGVRSAWVERARRAGLSGGTSRVAPGRAL